jgi:hypothetical protein
VKWSRAVCIPTVDVRTILDEHPRFAHLAS